MIRLTPNKIMQGYVGTTHYTISRFEDDHVLIVAVDMDDIGGILSSEIVNDYPISIEDFTNWYNDIKSKHGDVFDEDHVDHFISDKNINL